MTAKRVKRIIRRRKKATRKIYSPKNLTRSLVSPPETHFILGIPRPYFMNEFSGSFEAVSWCFWIFVLITVKLPPCDTTKPAKARKQIIEKFSKMKSWNAKRCFVPKFL